MDLQDQTSSFFQQVSQSNQTPDYLNQSLNPGILPNTSIVPNKQAADPNNPVGKSFNWLWQYFDYNSDLDYISLSERVFASADDKLFYKEVHSNNGNLSIFEVIPNRIHCFRARSFNAQSTMLDTQILWDQSISVFVNNAALLYSKSLSGVPQNLSIPISSGWNDIDIYLFTKQSNRYFSLNGDLGLVSDDWEIGGSEPATPPVSINVKNYTESTDKKSPNSAFIQWLSPDQKQNRAFSLYRRGPYTTVLEPPVINSTSSGYYTTGIIGVYNDNIIGFLKDQPMLDPIFYAPIEPAYYTISAVYSGSETLPSNIYKVIPGPEYSGVTMMTGYQSIVSSGTMEPGAYTYMVLANNPVGYIRPRDSQLGIVVAITGNSATITWSGTENVDQYLIMRFSGMVQEFGQLNSGVILTGIPSSEPNIFIDTKNNHGIPHSNFQEARNKFYGYDLNTQDRVAYKNNSFILNWSHNTSGLSGVQYKIYRTFYSGVYGQNSLVSVIGAPKLSYIDSGTKDNIENQLGSPKFYDYVKSVDRNTYNYIDVGLKKRGTYDYKLSSINYLDQESPTTTGFNFVAGDPFAPNTPSGVSITSLNGFATIGWQNGVEPDLDATIIYQSDSFAGPYGEVGRTQGNSFTRFIGYSGSPWFKLGNIDTSENISSLTPAIQGSGTMTVENIILKDFDILSTVDIDMDYYLYSGISVPTSAPYRSHITSMVNPADIFDSGNLETSSFCVTWLDSASSNTMRMNEMDATSIGFQAIFDLVPTRISGIYSTRISQSVDTDTNQRHMVTYYTGASADGDYYMHYRSYVLGGGTWTQNGSSTSGIRVGNYLNGKFSLVPLQPQPNPVIISYSGNLNKNVIIFLSGNSSDTWSFGFGALTYAGLLTGTYKYMPLDSQNMNNYWDFSACFDNDGFIHLLWAGGITGENLTNNLLWYKIDFTPTGTQPIRIVQSGQYTRGVPAKGGYLFPESFTIKNGVNYPRVFCDREENINIFFRQFGNTSRLISYSKMNTSGNVSLTPNVLYQTPFPFDPNSWNVTYGRNGDLAYSNYNMTNAIDPYQRNTVYDFKEGAYRRRHEYERFTDGSLYQILQSIIK